MADAPSERFRVVWSERNRQAVRILGRKAIALGFGDDFVSSMDDIEQKLETEPHIWGDPQYHLQITGFTVRHGMHRFVDVYYAVNEESRLVLIKEIRPLPYSELT